MQRVKFKDRELFKDSVKFFNRCMEVQVSPSMLLIRKIEGVDSMAIVHITYNA